MDVINLCDSDDDETDTQERQNQRLDKNQSSRSPPAANATTSRATMQRPRSVSSVSNNAVQSDDDIVCLSDGGGGNDETRQEQFMNSRAQRKSNNTSKSAGPVSARQKSWAMFQSLRLDAVQKQTEPSAPATPAAPKKSPPATQEINSKEKRKRKRSNSSSETRKKSIGSSTTTNKPAVIKGKKNDNKAPRQKPSFLEQGLDNGTMVPDHPQKLPSPHAAKNPLDLFASLDSFEGVELYDGFIPTNDDNHQDERVPATLKTTSTTSASPPGATLQAAIEIGSDDDDDDDDDVVEVQQREKRTVQKDSRKRDERRSQPPQTSRVRRDARSPNDNFHPLLQLDSAQPTEQHRDSTSAQNDLPLSQESESVVRILDHRFKGGNVIFDVKDCYDNVHKGIELEDLKVDAPALLSNYILKKARGKLRGKVFRQWAEKTKKKLEKKAKRNMARQERSARENVAPHEPREASNISTRPTAKTSQVPIGAENDNDEGELEFDLGSSPTAGGKSPSLPESERRPSVAPIDSQRAAVLDDTAEENDENREASASEVDIARESEIQVDRVLERTSSPLLKTVDEQDDDEQDDDSNIEMTNSQQSFERPLEQMSVKDSEDPANMENNNEGLQETDQIDGSENRKASLQMGVRRTTVPELDEEVLPEQTEDNIDEPVPHTPEGTAVGARPAYSVSDVAMELLEEEDDDDEIEVVDVKPPPRREEPEDDSSDESVLSVAPPAASAPRQPLVGSIETPIDIDDNDDDDEATTFYRMGRSFPTTGEKNKAPTPAPSTGFSYSERRFVFHQTQPRRPPPSARRPTASTWSYGWSCDAAMKEQERLFQASAAKMRTQATARVASSVTVARKKAIKFQQVVPNIAEKYPLHWQFSDYSARLGLPEGSSEAVIKKQYRRLALIYHPDKSQLPNTATKFQNITEAYRALLNR